MRSKPGPPMTLANMRQNGVRAVSATCQACGHQADISVDALPETLTVPEAGKRFRCGSCGGKTISTRPAWHTAQRQGVVFLGSVEPNAGAPSPRSDWAPGGPDSGLCPKPAQDGGVARRQTAALSLIDQIGSPCVSLGGKKQHLAEKSKNAEPLRPTPFERRNHAPMKGDYHEKAYPRRRRYRDHLPRVRRQVNGYYRSNGTYVTPYERSAPDGTVTNNWSFQGNVNPYTGAVGHNDYTHSPSSPFYRGY